MHLDGVNIYASRGTIPLLVVNRFLLEKVPEPGVLEGIALNLATIVLSVEPSLLYLIGDPEDPIAVWRKLGDQFQKKAWVNKFARG